MTRNELKYYQKLKQKKYRELENKFIAEGVHLINECLLSRSYRNNIEIVIARNDFNDPQLFKNLKQSGVRIQKIESRDFESLSETVNPQGILGVVKKNPVQSESDFKDDVFVAALDRINDPGNLGTIVRTCYCFGVDRLLLSEGSADVFNSKTIRSAQGALFHLNISEGIALADALKALSADHEIILTDPAAELYLDDHEFKKKKGCVIVFGNEAEGISKEILKVKNYDRLKIRSYSGCESLNIAVSAGIVLNHAASFMLDARR